MIKTSSWWQPLPADHMRIGISRGTPRRQPAGFRRYTKLNPGPWFNSCATPEEYVERYDAEVLSRLDARRVVAEIEAMVAVLLCFERPNTGTWCHRSLVSSWLERELGIEVRELGYEDRREHPLRPTAPGARLLP